jgi:protein involved in polysaccharide export with SLBB domain
VRIRNKRLGGLAVAACIAGPLMVAGCSRMASMPLAPTEPAPDSGLTAELPQYRLQIGDVLQVRLPLTPEFNDEVTIRPDGRISTSFVNDADAYNRTVPELTAALREDYAQDMRNPHLSVIVKSFAPYRVYVAGEVTVPGEYSTQGPNLTLSQAIARAGGLKLSGESKDIFILRRGPHDVPEFLATKYHDVMRGIDPSGDVRLARYDVVFVPRSSIAELYLFFNQYLQQFVPVSWGFSYLVNSSGSTSVVQAPPVSK